MVSVFTVAPTASPANVPQPPGSARFVMLMNPLYVEPVIGALPPGRSTVMVSVFVNGPPGIRTVQSITGTSHHAPAPTVNAGVCAYAELGSRSLTTGFT